MRKPIRAVAILIKDKKILLIHRINKREYYVFPGGGVEANETVEEAVLRELREETSIKAKVLRPLYHHHIIEDSNESDQYFYLCGYICGQPALSQGNEMDDMKKGIDFYEPLWLPFEKLSKTLVYPLEIRDWLLEDMDKGFPEKPREATLKLSELRQVS